MKSTVAAWVGAVSFHFQTLESAGTRTTAIEQDPGAWTQNGVRFLLHHTSQKKAITKGEGEKPGWECWCVRGCVHVRVCVRASAYAYVWVHLYAR